MFLVELMVGEYTYGFDHEVAEFASKFVYTGPTAAGVVGSNNFAAKLSDYHMNLQQEMLRIVISLRQDSVIMGNLYRN